MKPRAAQQKAKPRDRESRATPATAPRAEVAAPSARIPLGASNDFLVLNHGLGPVAKVSSPPAK